MTPREWMQDELHKVGLNMQQASLILGFGKNYLRGIKDFDSMDAICTMTDINRYLQGKESINSMKRHRKRKMKQTMQAKWKERKRKQAAQMDDDFDGFDW